MALRIAALYLTSTLLLLLALGAALYLSTSTTLLEARRQDLEAMAADDAAFLQLAVNREADLRTLGPLISASLPLPTGSSRSLRIFSSNGTLLVALPPESAGAAGRPSQTTLDLLPIGILALTLTPDHNPDLVYGAQAIRGITELGQPGTIGVVEAAQSRADIDRILDRLRRAFALAAGLAALVAVGTGLILARSIARPVRRLEAVATAIAAGDLSRRATGLPHNEIGALGESFNAMAARLAGLLDEARGEQARLAALLTALADGVL
ncbi:MAG TPA: HAMP domain-containing protein, partial [Chloroflexia bacterium]|nr:HAMP domain-containing protein [Chloroflexia bacterium]